MSARSCAWLALAMLLALALAGCSGLVSRAGAGLGDDLSRGILDQDDPATVADGLPAYLLLLDGLGMEWREIRVPRDPGCGVCGPGSELA